MTISRRDLLKYGLGSVAFSLGATQMWGLAAQAAKLAPRQAGRAKILVVVQLSGGNDGLNMVVPYGIGQYYQLRPNIGIPQDKVLKLNQQVGLNPAMGGLHDLFQDGKLAVIQAAGYPSPNRSHFRSIEIWQTADPDKIADTGWLGRYLDIKQGGKDDIFPAVNVDPMLPKTLFGSQVNVPTVSNINDFQFQTDPFYRQDRQSQISAFNDIYASYGLKRPSLDVLQKAGIDANLAADKLHSIVNEYKGSAKYPDGNFGNSLKFISQMISGGLNCTVYGASLDGFDTHTNQVKQQDGLLKQLSDGIAAFYADLKAQKLENDVVLMTFSEFGRRVAENGGRGTDHGTAEPLFLVGGMIKGGVYGDHASLSDLDNGDLKYQVDFRSVYSCLLDKWLDSDSKGILGRRFEDIGFLA